MDKKFIKTSDDTTRELLIQCGYTLLNKEGSFWVFLNNGKILNFADDHIKVVMTDYLNMQVNAMYRIMLLQKPKVIPASYSFYTVNNEIYEAETATEVAKTAANLISSDYSASQVMIVEKVDYDVIVQLAEAETNASDGEAAGTTDGG